VIYLVEDNGAIRETVRAYLDLAGYEVREFGKTEGVAEALDRDKPELCILDVMLGDGNGFALAKRIKAVQPQCSFIFLTARESESDRITGFELGAEDYIVKPFSPRELVLRVQAVLRRTGSRGTPAGGALKAEEQTWTMGDHRLSLGFAAHRTACDGAEVKLTAVEWKILSFLAERSGLLVSRERILADCLEYHHEGSERTINTHMKNLRIKLAGIPWIETVRGFGYKFVGTPGSGPA
jgi:DNA-binding response OmpR family regulator